MGPGLRRGAGGTQQNPQPRLNARDTVNTLPCCTGQIRKEHDPIYLKSKFAWASADSICRLGPPFVRASSGQRRPSGWVRGPPAPPPRPEVRPTPHCLPTQASLLVPLSLHVASRGPPNVGLGRETPGTP